MATHTDLGTARIWRTSERERERERPGNVFGRMIPGNILTDERQSIHPRSYVNFKQDKRY